MTQLEKIFYGLLLTLVLSFGGLLYNGITTRVTALEGRAQEEIKAASQDAVTLSELKGELKYIRHDMERLGTQTALIEQKLDNLLRFLGSPRELRALPPRRSPSLPESP